MRFIIIIIHSGILYAQYFGVPYFSKNKQVIKHKYYRLSYSEEHEQAYWVSYFLDGSKLPGKVSRTDDFRIDPNINTMSATLFDYKGSGYDRGHLVPAGDMGFSKVAMSESFYMSNMSPQNPSFNRGVWKRLESLVRSWAKYEGQLYIVTGPVLTKKYPSIGESRVSIPEYYYKAILDYSEPEIKCVAFLLPNKKSKKSLRSFSLSVDEIERITGIDFFHDLPDNIENRIESVNSINLWSTPAHKRKTTKNLFKSTNQEPTGVFKININDASKTELISLPGIGNKLSDKIINHRNIHGKFNRLDELMDIKGIGRKTVEKIRPYVTF